MEKFCFDINMDPGLLEVFHSMFKNSDCKDILSEMHELIELGMEAANESITINITDVSGKFIPDVYSGVNVISDIKDMTVKGSSYSMPNILKEEIFIKCDPDEYKWVDLHEGEHSTSLALTYVASNLQKDFDEITDRNEKCEVYHFSSLYSGDLYEKYEKIDVFGSDTGSAYGDSDLDLAFKYCRKQIYDRLCPPESRVLFIGGEKTSASCRPSEYIKDCVYFNQDSYDYARKTRLNRKIKGEDFLVDIMDQQFFKHLMDIMESVVLKDNEYQLKYSAINMSYIGDRAVLAVMESFHLKYPLIPIFGVHLIPDYSDTDICCVSSVVSSRLEDYVCDSSKFNIYQLQVLSEPINGKIVFKSSHGLIIEEEFEGKSPWKTIPFSQVYDYLMMEGIHKGSLKNHSNLRRALTHYHLVMLGPISDILMNFAFCFDFDSEKDEICESEIEKGKCYIGGVYYVFPSIDRGILKYIWKNKKLSDQNQSTIIFDMKVPGNYMDRRLYMFRKGIVCGGNTLLKKGKVISAFSEYGAPFDLRTERLMDLVDYVHRDICVNDCGLNFNENKSHVNGHICTDSCDFRHYVNKKTGEVDIPRIVIHGIGYSPLDRKWVYHEEGVCDLFYDKEGLLSHKANVVGIDLDVDEFGKYILKFNPLSMFKLLNAKNVYSKSVNHVFDDLFKASPAYTKYCNSFTKDIADYGEINFHEYGDMFGD